MNKIDILVPELPESVAHATVIAWHKKIGDDIKRNDVLVDIETDKVIIEVPASEDGILENIIEKEGNKVNAKQVLGKISIQQNETNNLNNNLKQKNKIPEEQTTQLVQTIKENNYSPSIRRLIAKKNLTHFDYENDINKNTENINLENNLSLKEKNLNVIEFDNTIGDSRTEKRVPMTNLRKCIAERLLEAKNNTAMLTTFNEVNMQSIIDLRKNYGPIFKEHHGISLGFMSFCIKAVLEALKIFPEINAYIDGDDIVYHNYFDINIAVSTPRGLVTPIIKNIDLLSISDIEKHVKILAKKGQDGKLKLEDLISGNFTITNSGIFGSLMSTPIINPPQSAILGMHTIKKRPMAINNQIIILPMMYLALSYDHRIIDGKESIGFLVKIKEMMEDPIRLLLNV